jgi:hypothetical protein
VGPNGEVCAAWNDYKANAIVFNRSFDGLSVGHTGPISPKTLFFDIALPAESFRGALVYRYSMSIDPPAHIADNLRLVDLTRKNDGYLSLLFRQSRRNQSAPIRLEISVYPCGSF